MGYIKHYRTLLVEDNGVDADIIKQYLSKSVLYKFDVLYARTITGAKEILETNTLDLVLLDLNLPDSSGFDTFKTISKAYPHVPIVITSGMAELHIAVKSVAEGAYEYLMKDRIDLPTLERIFREVDLRKGTKNFIKKTLEKNDNKLQKKAGHYSEQVKDAYQRIVLDLAKSDYVESPNYQKNIENFISIFESEGLKPKDLNKLKSFQNVIDSNQSVLDRLNTYILSSSLEKLVRSSIEVFNTLEA